MVKHGYIKHECKMYDLLRERYNALKLKELLESTGLPYAVDIIRPKKKHFFGYIFGGAKYKTCSLFLPVYPVNVYTILPILQKHAATRHPLTFETLVCLMRTLVNLILFFVCFHKLL